MSYFFAEVANKEFLVNRSKLLFYFYTSFGITSFFLYIFLWSRFSPFFLILNVVLSFFVFYFFKNLNKILLSNFIFLIPKILEFSVICVISSIFTFLFLLDTPVVFLILWQNFLCLSLFLLTIPTVFLCFSKLFLCFHFAFSSNFFYYFFLILFSFSFCSKNAEAIDPTAIDHNEAETASEIIIAADNYTVSEINTKITAKERRDAEEISYCVTGPITQALLNHDKDAFKQLVMDKQPVIGRVLGTDTINENGFASKQLLHLINILINDNDFLLFTKDICKKEGINVFSSYEDVEAFGNNSDKTSRFCIYKQEKGSWVFYHEAQPVPSALAAFLDSWNCHPCFKTSVEPLSGISYRQLSFGDAIFKNNHTKNLEFFEFKTRIHHNFQVRNNLYNDFVNIKPHLEAQISYPSDKIIFQRPAFGEIFMPKKSIYQGQIDYSSSEALREKLYQGFCMRSFQQKNLMTLSQKIDCFNKFIVPNLLRKFK